VRRKGVIVYRQGHYIDSTAEIGEGTKIGAGHDIARDVVIGKNCLIQCHVSIPVGTLIGDRVFIGPGVKMSNDKYILGIDAENDRHLRPPRIDDDVRIGLGALIGAGVRLGQGCVIGQGANVVKSVDPYTLVIGDPARFYARVDEKGQIIQGTRIRRG
jgi:UDP-2-acetamido-3-amino-2,3-dideoxy-glucuronate N-acetyltransferase